MSLPSAAAGGFRSGFVTVVGRPNVGKSTLVNALVGQKVAIVSDKPQTTRNRILSVLNRQGGQIVLFDTPGIHKPVHRMNRRMVAAAIRSLQQVDVVLWLVDVTETIGPGDRYIQDTLSRVRAPVLLGVNKIDRVGSKEKLLPMMRRGTEEWVFVEVLPV